MTSDPQTDDLIPPGCGLFAGWLLAATLGMGLGWALGWWLSFLLPGWLAAVGLMAVTGLLLGTLQWLLLRGLLKYAVWWIPATLAGWGGGFLIGSEVAQRLGLTGAYFGVVTGLVTGMLVGLAQWLVLFRQVSRAGWWFVASSFAVGSSFLYYQPGVTAWGLLYGAIYGIVTGVTVMWLLYRPVADKPEPEPESQVKMGEQ